MTCICSASCDLRRAVEHRADRRGFCVALWAELQLDRRKPKCIARAVSLVQQRVVDLGYDDRMRAKLLPRRHCSDRGYVEYCSGDWRRIVQLRRCARRPLLPAARSPACRTRRLCAAPVVTCAGPSNIVPTGGGSVSLFGLSFISIDVSPSASLERSVSCSSASWISATLIACAPNYYRGGTARIGATLSTVVGTGIGLFSFDGAHADRPLPQAA
jgi:hypothetical protein